MGDIGENLPSSPESEKDRKEKSGLEALQRKLGAYGKAHARLQMHSLLRLLFGSII